MKITAPAKLNLFFHITGRRPDHYHLIESIFAFTQFGDDIEITSSEKITLKIDGNFSAVLQNESIENNLILRAAHLLQKTAEVKTGAAITLKKNIPIAAGLGGGSSDAAAILKTLNQFWNINLDEKKLAEMGLTLGADIPVCLYQQSAFVFGIGEIITPITLPVSDLYILLVNPNKPLSTKTVFETYHQNTAPFSSSVQKNIVCACEQEKLFFDFLTRNKNDLELPATQLMPEISEILSTLKKQNGCALSKMSGSGPTCFALFKNKSAAENAALDIQNHYPTWWIQLTRLY